jgi:hypothetical protein
MPRTTLEALRDAKTSIVQYRNEPGESWPDRLHADQDVSDPRWSHAKVYAVERGRSKRIIVTSANFSQAAWGREDAGLLQIRNFELGVCVHRGEWPLLELYPFESPNYAVADDLVWHETSCPINWAEATWNGDKVEVACRCCDPHLLTCTVRSMAAGTASKTTVAASVSKWELDESGLSRGSVNWRETHESPDTAIIQVGDTSVEISVFDAREPADRYLATPHGVDEDLAVVLRDEMLFEQYGGEMSVVLHDDSALPEGHNSELLQEGNGPMRDSYDVAAFVKARRHLRVVDTWSARMTRNSEDDVYRDGHLLAEAFDRQQVRDERAGQGDGLGAMMAAEEMRTLLGIWVSE